MSEPFLSEIQMYGFNFAPQGWATCDGQLLPISQNQALFSLLGTMYGGDGRTTFGLPDLRSRAPMHFGQGPGLSNRPQGQKSGSETHTITPNEMPSHSHDLMATNTNATADRPGGELPASAEVNAYGSGGTSSMSSRAVGSHSPGGQAHNNMQPYLTINFCIALTGQFPSRN
jgi:microcystin-dependent protein